MKKAKVFELQEGEMFCVPLVEGAGFGFGYIALAQKGWGYLFDIFDHVAATDTPPDDIEKQALIVRNLLGNGARFTKSRNNPNPWYLLNRQVATIAPIQSSLFQIGGKAYDMRDGQQVHDPSIDIPSLPYKSYPLDNSQSFLITAKLLRCDFDLDDDAGEYRLIR